MPTTSYLKINQPFPILKKAKKFWIVFYLKSGKEGKTFGSISTKQISDALKNEGILVDKKCIHLATAIDTLGHHEVEIELHKKVICKIMIEIKEK